MKKIEVYADFDWLKDIELIGELSYEVLRGSETYGFQFSNDWQKKYGTYITATRQNANVKFL